MADLASMLADLDAATLARIDRTNPARVQRAWEVLRATGKGLAGWQSETGAALLAPDQTLRIVLSAEKDWLTHRITRRFDAMLQGGALDEVRAALPHWDPGARWARAIGAADLVAHLRGQIGAQQAADRACIASRQYAKRQRTWFRARMQGWHWLDAAGLAD